MNATTFDQLVELITAIASAPALDEAVEAPTQEPTVSAKRAENQRTNRLINARLSNATKAFNKVDPDTGEQARDLAGMLKGLEEARALVPTHKTKSGTLAWQSTFDRIDAKANAFADVLAKEAEALVSV